MSIRGPHKNEPTLPGPIFVGTDRERERFLRFYQVFIQGFLLEEPNLRGFSLSGNISDWIRRLLTESLTASVGVLTNPANLQVKNLVANIAGLTRDLLDPGKAKGLSARAESYFQNKDVQKLQSALEANDPVAYDNAIKELAKKSCLQFQFSIEKFLQSVRALRATLFCAAVHKANPLQLIDLADDGDRNAVLTLVKTDKLFLTDPCTRNVINMAALNNDCLFQSQLRGAQAYKSKPRGKTSHRLCLYALFVTKYRLPPIAKLFLWLDPEGKAFRSTAAFEKFVERCKKDFIVLTAASEP